MLKHFYCLHFYDIDEMNFVNNDKFEAILKCYVKIKIVHKLTKIRDLL